MKSRTKVRIAAWAGVGILALTLNWAGAQQGRGAVSIDSDDIGGVVTSSRGPEAGDWDPKAVDFVLRAPGLSDADRRNILGGSTAKLLRIG